MTRTRRTRTTHHPRIRRIRIITRKMNIRRTSRGHRLTFAIRTARVIKNMNSNSLVKRVTGRTNSSFMTSFLLITNLLSGPNNKLIQHIQTIPRFQPTRGHRNNTKRIPTVNFSRIRLTFTVLINLITLNTRILRRTSITIRKRRTFIRLINLFRCLSQMTKIILRPIVPGHGANANTSHRNRQRTSMGDLFQA